MIRSKNKITLFNIASTITLQGLAFISGPIFSSILGPGNYGIAAVYLTWVQIASTVFSLQAAGTVALARVNFPMEDQEKFQSSVFSLATFSFLIFSGVTLLITLLTSSHTGVSIPMVVLGLLHAWGWYCVTAMNSKFTYEFKADKNFILSVTTSALTIGLSIILIRLFPAEQNYWGRIIGQSAVYTCIGLILFTYMLRTGKTVYNREYWMFTLPLAVPTVFHLLAHIVLNQSDKVMLKGMVGNSAAGIYALASTFAAVLNTLWHAFNNSWVPFYYEYTRKDQTEEMKKHAKNYIELFTILTMGFILLCREVFHIYAKSSFWEGTDLIPLFSIGYYFVFLYSFPVNYEFFHKKTKVIATGTTLAAIFNIILNIIFIKRFEMIGAAIATMIAHMLQFLFHYYMARTKIKGNFPYRLSLFYSSVVTVILTAIISFFLGNYAVIRWAIGIILGLYLINVMIKRKSFF